MDAVGKFENTDSIPVQKLVVLSEHNSMIKSSSIANQEKGASIYGITHDGLYAIKDNEIYNLSVNYTTGDISFNKLMDSPYEFKNAYFSYSDAYCIPEDGNVYTIDFEKKEIKKINNDVTHITNMPCGKDFLISKNDTGFFFTELVYDDKVVYALRYKGETYYKQLYTTGKLTAKQEDVASGKTFIGYNAIPATGTMEVTN